MKYPAPQLNEFVSGGSMPDDVTAQMLAEATDQFGNPLLCPAAWFGNLPKDCTIERLVNTRDQNECTALHYAIFSGHIPNNVTLTNMTGAIRDDNITVLQDFVLIFQCGGYLPQDRIDCLAKLNTTDSQTNHRHETAAILHQIRFVILTAWICLGIKLCSALQPSHGHRTRTRSGKVQRQRL